MRGFFLRSIGNAVGFWIAAEWIDGVQLTMDFGSVLLVALVFGIVNALVKPLVQLLALPLIVLTIGLFSLVINAAMLLLTDALLEQLSIATFWDAILASLVISVVGAVVNVLIGR